jgi:hypothetical protein
LVGFEQEDPQHLKIPEMGYAETGKELEARAEMTEILIVKTAEILTV